MIYLGIDVSKLKLDAALLLDTTSFKCKNKAVKNTADGVQSLIQWCAKQGVDPACLHVILEATGRYHESCAELLYDAGVVVSIVNPAQVRDFAKALAQRGKTDALDSQVLARFGLALQPLAWQAPALAARQLQALLTRRAALAKDLRREMNRQEKALSGQTPELVMQSIEQAVSFIAKELKRLDRAIDEHIDRHPDLKDDQRLLTSIPGVGPQVSRAMMAVMHNHRFSCAEALAAYLGLVPVPRQSGSSVQGRTRLAKNGPSSVRALLYLAAVAATRYNPHIQALYVRLQANGKSKMSALGAAMRKLVHLCFGVIKTRRAYQPDYALHA